MIGYRTQPEPFASAIDIITAAQFIEKAIHASTGQEASDALQKAIEQLQNARGYFVTAMSLNKLYSMVYGRLVIQVDRLIQELGSMSNAVKQLSGGQLATYESGTIYQFQGQMRLLYVRVQELMRF